MKIKAIGKQRMCGTSKRTGNDYDFNIVFYVGRVDDRVIGEQGCQVNLDPDLIPFNDIQVGATYDVEFGPKDRVVSFTPVK